MHGDVDGRQANGIIFTTMQKFEESHDSLSERRNILVMADEATMYVYKPMSGHNLMQAIARAAVSDVHRRTDFIFHVKGIVWQMENMLHCIYIKAVHMYQHSGL